MLSLRRSSSSTRSLLDSSDSDWSSDRDSDSSVVHVSPPRRRDRHRGIRQGLAGLGDPPPPFGQVRLGLPHPPAPRTASAQRARHPYQRSGSARPTILARPTQEPSEEAGQVVVPRPDPEYVYETLGSAWRSIEALAREYLPRLMRYLSGADHPDRVAPIVPLALLAGLYWRPNWIWSTGRMALLFVRETVRFYVVLVREGPFDLFQRTLFVHVISNR